MLYSDCSLKSIQHPEYIDLVRSVAEVIVIQYK